MAKITFKTDNQKQSLLLPPSLDELIPATHSVRVVNAIIDRLDVDAIVRTYRGGGNSCFHPRQMLKILVYAYLNNIYSSRRIAQQLWENIHYMWLSGGAKPDFRTINYFRGKRLKGIFDDLFRQVVELLHKEGFVSLEVQYIDGTKIESAANKYSFVWRGSVEKHDKRLREKTDAVLRDIEQVIHDEQQEADTESTLPTEEFISRVERIKERMDSENLSKSHCKAIRKVEGESIPRMKEYERHLTTMGERNSYSKSDPDATFMRMKEDAMLNGQLKPGYNVQIATENQFITNYGIFQRPTDTGTLIDFLESFHKKYGLHSREIVADAGYGSQQNYEYMFEKGMIPYVKYNYFHKEQTRAFRNNPFLQQNLKYDPSTDEFTCPAGKSMVPISCKNPKLELGYRAHTQLYQASDCTLCPLRRQCYNAEENRIIRVNHTLNEYKRTVRELLTSQRGMLHRSRRPIEPEAVFGHIKADRMFRRFRLRSLEKVNIEFGIVALAHNIRKMATNTRLSSPNNDALSQTGRCRSAKYPLATISQIMADGYIICKHKKEAA
ncbi:IS1182 family transposase [Alistipes onderdonkii]|uniref:IS1182 family transposase n=1 Tax=Alistipes onderdonkii TaxID=328813 RepID=UPI001E4C8403|nr:IS1182 family transposase [Alistipes onderdonkii]